MIRKIRKDWLVIGVSALVFVSYLTITVYFIGKQSALSAVTQQLCKDKGGQMVKNIDRDPVCVKELK